MASLGGKIKNKLKDVIGNNDHAVIVVWDYRTSRNEKLGGETSISKAGKKALKSGLTDLMSANKSGGEAKSYRVQFNPSSLHITAHNEKTTHASVTGTAKGEVKAESVASANLSPSIDLQVALIFDKVNPADAFVGDKFSTLASAQGVANLATYATKGHALITGKKVRWTVQPEVEAFLAAVRKPETRTMTFLWKDFQFNGFLKNINVEYTMFSTSGRPIRAKVTLHLRQETNNNNKENWISSFTDVFGSSGQLSFNKLID